MRLNSKRYLGYLTPLLGVLLVACGSGSTSNSNTDSGQNTGSLDSLNLTAPTSYPAATAVSIPVVVQNNGSTAINNLNYLVESNTTGAPISISTTSAAGCKVIAAHASCTLMADVGATPPSQPGNFNVAVSQGAVAANSHSLSATTKSILTSVGLVQLPTNTASGADGLTLYYPSTIIGNANGTTQMIVTAVVTSANAGAFNTINLIDGNGNPLNYTLLSGNSGNGMTNLAIGSVVSLLVTVPSGSTQVQFKAQTTQNGSNPVNATNSNTTVVTNPAVPTGILNVSPNYFNLTPTYESQIVTINNSGNGSLTGLSFTPVAPLTELSSNCGATLESGTSCQYVVKFDKNIPQAGTTTLNINYNNGSAQSATATVKYTGADPVAGLTITSNSANFDFNSRTATPTDAEYVILTNTSTNSSESGFTFAPLNHFSTSQDVGSTGLTACTPTTTLAPQARCALKLTYTNSAVTAATTADVQVDYKYGSDARDAHSTVGVTYQTVQSQAVLALSPAPATFSKIVNNGVESASQTITLTNSSTDQAATGISKTITGTNANLFTQTSTTCGATLAAGAACTYTLKFGPTTTNTGSKTATLNVSYTPYTGATALTTNATLNGQVAAAQGANIAAAQSAHAGWAGGDGLSANTAYAVQQNATAPTISYTITNSGTVPANNFYLSGTPGIGWTMNNGCGSSGSKKTLDAASTCTVEFTAQTSTVGSTDLVLSNISMNWVDQDTPTGESQALSGSVEAMVYAPAIATVSPGTAEVAPGESVSFTVTLAGGYNVASTAVAINGVSNITGGICGVGESTNTCQISVAANGSAAAQSYALTVFGENGLTTSPPYIQLTVKPITKMIFTTSYGFNGDLRHGGGSRFFTYDIGSGYAGANKLCQEVAAQGIKTDPLNATWVALLDGNNATHAGTKYANSLGQTIAIATDGNLNGWAPVPSPYGASLLMWDQNGRSVLDAPPADGTIVNATVWTGQGKAQNGICMSANGEAWSTEQSSSKGVTGFADRTSTTQWANAFRVQCDGFIPDPMRELVFTRAVGLYCVQQ